MRYYLSGRINPQSCSITIPTVELKTPELKMTFNCDSSIISIIVYDTEVDTREAYIRSQEVVHIIVSCYGFSHSSAYDAELISISVEDNESTVIKVSISELIQTNPDKIYNELVDLSLKDIYIRHAIIDYTRALSNVRESAFLCYRAIETVKGRFLKENSTPNEGWVEMHLALGTNRKEIDEQIIPFANPIRHGNYSSFKGMTYHQSLNVYFITRNIIYKYKSYLEELERPLKK